MKKTRVYLLLFLLALGLGACQKIDDGSFVEPITVYEKINGEWTLASVKMVDEFAKANAISPDEQDITSWFNYNTFVIQLNADANNKATSYAVTGDVPLLFPKEGYWDLDTAFPNTDQKAVRINLYSDAAKTQLTDQLRITTIPGAVETLEVKLVRESNEVALTSYLFTLNPTE